MSNAKYMVFIDGSNMLMGEKRFNKERRSETSSEEDFKMDYEKLIILLEGMVLKKNIIRFYYYSGIHQNPTEDKVKFFKSLRKIGFDVTTTLLRTRKYKCKHCHKKNIRYREKGIDTSFTTDLLWHAFFNNYDTAILFTGDDDFAPPIKMVKRLGKRVEMWAFKGTIGREMNIEADKIIYINDIIEEIKKE